MEQTNKPLGINYLFSWKPKTESQKKKILRKEFEEFLKTIPLKVTSIDTITQTLFYLSYFGYNIYSKDSYKEFNIIRVYSRIEYIAKMTETPLDELIDSLDYKIKQL